jgi:L-rhamnose mutarotase
MFRLLAIAAIALTLSSSCAPPARQVRRFGSVIGLRAEKAEEYKRLHRAVWPDVTKAVHDANIRNYSIYLRRMPDGNLYLFSYLEYTGANYAADMARLAANPKVKEWWTLTNPCQQPLAGRNQGEWWAAMEEVFHQD